jgi:maltooligosyltrehalose trehalohydrolase
MSDDLTRRVPIGAEVQPGGSTHFRVWAPRPHEIALILLHDSAEETRVPLEPEAGGYHSVLVPGVGAGARYQFDLDGERLADPASRFQPDGPFGPSAVVNPEGFAWRDQGWHGLRLENQVIAEIHVGTFTPDGTWRAAGEHLPDLARTGITVVEIMPVAEFPGRFGWGYDGVFPYAPTQLYGTPDDLRSFVDRAHEIGLGVILDVVYNHLGPDGCVFRRYSESYFSTRYPNEWGDPLNFDDEASAPVREYFTSNAAYWIAEFHLDGLRLDATQSVHDASTDHILSAITRSARRAAPDRDIIIVSENEPQDVRMLRPLEQGGHGMDAVWNDDFHHSAVVALTGRREAYYTDHRGSPQEFVSAAKHGYLFQGQRYAWQNKNRGTRTKGVRPAAFVNFIENHDQLANSGDGSRMHTRAAPGLYRAMTAVFILLPGTPMLFQGQEFGSTVPFLYFADHRGELAESVRRGRAEFVSQFTSLASPEVQARLPVPHDPATFERCKLNWAEQSRHMRHWRLHADLLSVRREELVFRQSEAGAVDGAILSPLAFALRYESAVGSDERLLVVNFGTDVVAASFPEPLLAPPDGFRGWTVRWSSEHPDYGGLGTPEVVAEGGWHIPGHSATLLRPSEDEHGGNAHT